MISFIYQFFVQLNGLFTGRVVLVKPVPPPAHVEFGFASSVDIVVAVALCCLGTISPEIAPNSFGSSCCSSCLGSLDLAFHGSTYSSQTGSFP
jgi:hypothetical protein